MILSLQPIPVLKRGVYTIRKEEGMNIRLYYNPETQESLQIEMLKAKTTAQPQVQNSKKRKI